jgi:hypothetical protein
VDGHFGPKTIFVKELPSSETIFVDKSGNFDVVAAVFGDFEEAAGAEPFDGLEAFGRFFNAERGGGDGIKGEAVVHGFLKFDEHIQGGGLAQVEDGVAVKDLVVEAEIVKTDHEIGPKQFGDELVDLFFAVDFVIAASSAVGHADAHAHVADVIPAAYFVGGLLRFQIKVDNIFGRGEPVDHGRD